MDKENLINMLKELFAENRIDIRLDDYNTYGEKGVKLSVQLDGDIVCEERYATRRWMD